MTPTKSPLILTTALLALPLGALAQDANRDLSYTWLELDYSILDVDVFDDESGLVDDVDDGNGWGVNGSFAFTPMFFGFAGYSKTDSDVTFSDDDTPLITSSADVEVLELGLGVNVPFQIGSLDTDFVGRAAYVDIDYGSFDFGGSDDPDLEDLDDDSSDGWKADASLRSQLTPRIEGSIGVGYLDVEGTDTFSALGSVLFELTPNWGINLAGDVGDDVSTYVLGVRYSFNRF
jgi:hypothetical protein